ncbi:hypothetical protein PVAP13_6NG073000 [Panicum virgatum]|uniref:Uncharacterized protein n=1 Tax=Panicum virgatum TaxID=38727 RepID=A0A8T0QVD8_PANVG|nr:hypothetical protein PVAP13_6NG073000 [Panicum virgatum]
MLSGHGDAHQILCLRSSLASIGPNKNATVWTSDHHMQQPYPVPSGPQSDYPFNYLLHDYLAYSSPACTPCTRMLSSETCVHQTAAHASLSGAHSGHSLGLTCIFIILLCD